MNLLLDTHVALWAIADSPKLTDKARALIQAPRATVWVSVASLWEITIKHALRRDFLISGEAALGYFQAAGFRILPIEAAHAIEVATLPAHHQDPFDRLLVAQALVEPMRLLSHDDKVALYSDTIIHV